MATTQDLAQQNQELQVKLFEYRDHSTQATTQINKDVQTLNQRLNDMEKTSRQPSSLPSTKHWLVNNQPPK
jgi:hypothetical protein